MTTGTLFISPQGAGPGSGGTVVIGTADARVLAVPNDGSGRASVTSALAAGNVLLGGAWGDRSNVGHRLTEVPVSSPGVSLGTVIGPDAVAPGGLLYRALAGPLPPERGGTGGSDFHDGALLYFEGGRMTSDPALRWDAAGQTLMSGASLTSSGGSNVMGESAGYSGRITFSRSTPP
jgi:hypothetical protein